MEEKIQILQNQVNSLQQRVIDLENQNLEKKGNLNMLSKAQNIRFKRTSKSEPSEHTLTQIKEANAANFD